MNLFAATFAAAGGEPVVARAPGRVNLVGDHTDYSGGFVLPAALTAATEFAVRRRQSPGPCLVVSTAAPADGVVAFDCSGGGGGAERAPAHWANYVQGVALEVLARLGAPEQGLSFEAAISSDVPLGGGLSSSAALEVAAATALCELYGLSLSDKERALLAWRAETGHLGMPCGIMDQFVSSCAQPGCALLIDCRSQTAEPVPIDSRQASIVIANSNVAHQLTGSEFPDRVRQAAEAARLLGVAQLRDASPESVAAADWGDDLLLRRRARHVVSENARTEAAALALRAGDYDEVGRLMTASHASLRDDYETSIPEIDALVEAALAVSGVLGSRITGGGFGGCTVSLVRPDAVDAATAALEALGATVHVTAAGGGASLLGPCPPASPPDSPVG